MRTLVVIAAVGIGLAVAGCGDDDDSDEPTTATQPAAEGGGKGAAQEKKAAGAKDEAAKPGTEVTVADSQFGQVLFDGDDQAIYLFDKESTDRSECYGACAEAWPPVLTEGGPVAGKGADAKLLGTTERDDGSTQVTYGGHPLYYYVDDPAGEVLCHNFEEFGGLWLVVTPGGEAVQS